MDIKKFIRPNIHSLQAYEAKEVPCRVKLDANESPYGFPEGLRALKSVKTNRYPDPEAKALKKLISRELDVKSKNILQGNGSDELIYYLITTFGGPVLYPVPTFSMYGIIAQAIGEKKIDIPLDKAFDLDLKRILVVMKKDKPKLLFLSSPNNPTGNCFSSEKILKIIESTLSISLVVVDEAYQPFSSRKGFLPLLKDYKNLVIMRTLSKIGLAGLRVGFLIADEEILSGLKKINGIKPYPSEANFILFRVKDTDMVYKRLLKKSVLVRNMKGVVDGCLRVTVGKPEENRIFLNTLKEILSISKS